MRQSEHRSGLPKVEKIHLPEKHMALRVVLLTAAIVVAAVSLVYGLTGLLNQQPGWQKIEAATKETSYSQEFTLGYDLGVQGVSATAEKKALTDLFSRSMEKAYAIFDTESQASGGLRWLSDHPNTKVSVDPALYQALETLKKAESRYLYLAPAYVEQNRIFGADSPETAAGYDPSWDPELKAYLQRCAEFAQDPAMIDLELLEDGQVLLKVSQAYLDFAEENEISCLLDLGWMRNAFICDWIAEQMTSQGFTLGIIASADGFTRNLDGREKDYSLNLFARDGNLVNVPGALQYRGPMALVQLRNYPLSQEDSGRYAVYPDGTVASRYLSLKDGLCHPAMEELLLYDRGSTCAELALASAALFLEGEGELSGEAVWTEGHQIRYSDPNAVFVPGVNGDAYTFRSAK